jgi:hypothetical protein
MGADTPDLSCAAAIRLMQPKTSKIAAASARMPLLCFMSLAFPLVFIAILL